jgi:hypothetical protein
VVPVVKEEVLAVVFMRVVSVIMEVVVPMTTHHLLHILEVMLEAVQLDHQVLLALEVVEVLVEQEHLE